MNRRVTRTPQARRDVVGLADYIAQGNSDAALRFLEAIDDTFRFLADNREAGELCRFRELRAQGIRAWPVQKFRNYVVFFRPSDDGIVVERVLHGARDLEALFGDRD